MKRKALLWAVIAIFMGNQAISQDWNYVSSTGTTYILFGMSFPPGQSTVGFACGMQTTYNAPGVIVKTTDGGDNWTQVWPISGTIDGLQGIWFINDNVGFACGWNNYFIKTTDGGATWNTITVGSNVWYYVDVEFWDEYNGVAAASMNNPGTQAVFVTSDGGTTWTPATSGVGTNEIMGLCYADQNTVFAVGTGNNVFKSTDGGHNWTTVATLSAMLFGVDFADANFGVAGGEEKIFATNDGGNSWTTFTTGYENFQAAKAFSDGTAYVGGTDENIYKTTDFGTSWVLDWDGPGFSHLYRIRFTPNTAGFACGSQGTILKREPQFAAGFSADDPNTCEGSTVNFTDQSIGNVVSWEWTFEGGSPGSSTIQNPSVTYSAMGDYDVQLVISDGVMYDTLLQQDYIHVEAVPQQPDTPTGPDQTCGGGAYEYSTGSIANADTYVWMVEPASAGTFSGSGTTGTLNTSTSWTGQYTVKVRAENECGQGPWSGTYQAELFHQPVQYFLVGGGSYCEGEPGIELILGGSETGVDYELYHDDVTTGLIIAGTGESLSFGYQTETGFYTVIGYTSTCEQLMGGESYISVHTAPGQAGIPDGPTEVCQGDTTVYSTSGATGADSYSWVLAPPEAGTLTATEMTAEISWAMDFSGDASLTVTGSNECGEGTESPALAVNIGISPSPSISGPQLVCSDYEETYQTEEVTGNSYSWEVAGGTITAGSGTHQVNVLWGYPGPGSLTVIEQNQEGCTTITDAYEVVIEDCTGIDEPGRNTGFQVYPNPAKDILNLAFEGEKAENLTITVISQTGQVMMMEHVPTLNKSVRLNISGLSEGIYTVRITREGDTLFHERIVKF